MREDFACRRCDQDAAFQAANADPKIADAIGGQNPHQNDLGSGQIFEPDREIDAPVGVRRPRITKSASNSRNLGGRGIDERFDRVAG
ncbi:MAG: hypothetical protein R3A47_07445 [Polyangiales bacterium]